MLAQYKRGSGNSHVVNIVFFLGATVTGGVQVTMTMSQVEKDNSTTLCHYI